MAPPGPRSSNSGSGAAGGSGIPYARKFTTSFGLHAHEAAFDGKGSTEFSLRNVSMKGGGVLRRRARQFGGFAVGAGQVLDAGDLQHKQRLLRRTQVELGMVLHNLPSGTDENSNPDPCVVVFEMDRYGRWKEVARTEVLQDQCHPVFSCRVDLEFDPEYEQPLKFVVYDWDAINCVGLLSQEKIGWFRVELGELLSARGLRVKQPLQGLSFEADVGRPPQIEVYTVVDVSQGEWVKARVGCHKLPMPAPGVLPAFVEVYAEFDGTENLVHRSEARLGQTVTWDEFSVPLGRVMKDGKSSGHVRFKVKTSPGGMLADVVLGNAVRTVGELLEMGKDTVITASAREGGRMSGKELDVVVHGFETFARGEVAPHGPSPAVHVASPAGAWGGVSGYRLQVGNTQEAWLERHALEKDRRYLSEIQNDITCRANPLLMSAVRKTLWGVQESKIRQERAMRLRAAGARPSSTASTPRPLGEKGAGEPRRPSSGATTDRPEAMRRRSVMADRRVSVSAGRLGRFAAAYPPREPHPPRGPRVSVPGSVTSRG